MYYFKVWVASQKFHGHEPLTYGFPEDIKIGGVVSLPLRNASVNGIIVSSTTKPLFSTKLITKVLFDKPLPSQSLQLLSWLHTYYPAPSGILASLFLPSALLVKKENLARYPVVGATNSPVLPELTKDQTHAIEAISKSAPKTTLLHGKTGTGKTRVYLELAQTQLKIGENVLVLTPEIALTSPLARIFKTELNRQTIVIHSNLSEKQKREAWLQILSSNEPLVVIGPRSALFAPFSNLGLIVVDESHDGAYKQDQAPYYQTTRVAAKLAGLHNAQLVLGTATPNIQDYYIAKAKHLPVVRMTEQAVRSSSYERVSTLVNSQEKDKFSQHPSLSDALIEAIRTALSNKEQSLVFLNRRGTARLVLCQTCGWQALCKNCDLPMTYHGDIHLMRCHTCGFSQPTVSLCPVCSSTDVIFKSLGTKALAQSLQRLFPEARIQRFDADNSKTEKFEANYAAIVAGSIDILVGTQLLIKGHDLPLLSVVGIVAADTSLYFPDYTAEEQTYQLLTQVLGRIGRGHRNGTAIIQSYNPTHPAVLSALSGDWESFYKSQLAERKRFGFPPFVQLMKLSVARATQSAAQSAATKLAQELREMSLPVQILGPTPRFLERVGNRYRWQIIVKSKSRDPLLKIIDILPANWTHDLDPSNLL